MLDETELHYIGCIHGIRASSYALHMSIIIAVQKLHYIPFIGASSY